MLTNKRQAPITIRRGGCGSLEGEGGRGERELVVVAGDRRPAFDVSLTLVSSRFACRNINVELAKRRQMFRALHFPLRAPESVGRQFEAFSIPPLRPLVAAR